MKAKKYLLATLGVGLLVGLFPLVTAAAPVPSDRFAPPDPECNPMALRLSRWMDVDCSVLMAYQAEGVGFGVIKKAYSLSQAFPDADLDWEDLVARHLSEEGLGWGQIKKAYLLAGRLGLDVKALLEQRAQGKGWGEILHEHREAHGKPPWAGQGPPPWARRGRPSWAGSRDTGE